MAGCDPYVTLRGFSAGRVVRSNSCAALYRDLRTPHAGIAGRSRPGHIPQRESRDRRLSAQVQSSRRGKAKKGMEVLS